MIALLLAAALSASAPPDGERPRFREAAPDAAMALARRAPTPFQPAALVVEDVAGGVAAGLAGALGGGCAGLALWAALPRLGTESMPAGGTVCLALTSSGALLGAAAAMLAWDLSFNTLHLARVLPSRVVLLAPAAPMASTLLALAAVERSAGPPPPAVLVVTRLAWGCGLACLPLAGLLLALPLRFRADQRDGSALWEQAD